MGYNRLASAQKTVPVQHNDPAAAAAADFDVRTGADHSPFTRAAGMRFPGGDDIPDENCFLHGKTLNSTHLIIRESNIAEPFMIHMI